MSVDLTSDVKSQTRFRNKHSKKIRELARRVRFDSTELDIIVIVYFKLLNDLGSNASYITRYQFRSILYKCFDMPEDFLIERIMVALDKGITPFVTLETWVQTMSIFLRGTLDERMQYAFAAYDILGDGLIRRDQLITLMRKSFIKQQIEDVEEAVKDFVDMLIKKMDVDTDGLISYADFSETVRNQPALLECFGQCLPDRASINAFLSTFTHKITKF